MRRLSMTTGWILVGLWLGITGRAHELTVAWTVAAGELQIHGTSEGTPAAGAAVELRGGDGTLLASGRLDAGGRFRSALPAADRLTVVVDAGFGHRRTVTLSAKDLQGGSAGPDTRAAPAVHDHEDDHNHAPPDPAHAGESRGRSDAAIGPLMRVGLGVTFLLALAAASMSYGNMRRLANLERRLPPDASRG